jgi:hypothetical protein
MMSRYHFLTFLLLLISADSFAVHLPLCEKDLPIVPAAIRDRQLEAELRAAEPDHPATQEWLPASSDKRSSAHLVLHSGLPAEEVLRFYQQMFCVEKEPSPPLARLSFHDHDSINDCYDERGRRILEGEKARAAMEMNRKPFKPGKWLRNASFFWVVHEDNGDLSELTLDIQDVSFSCREGSDQQGITETLIRFSRITWPGI